MVVTQDITKQKQAEIALQRMKNELKIKYQKLTIDLKTANQQLREEIIDRKLAEAHIQAALREKEVLLKEIHHRVKNNMQVISSLLQLQAQYIEDEETLSLFEESQSRIHSMALIHEQLYQSDNLARIDIQTYVEHLVANLFQSFGCSNNFIEISLNIDPIYLNI